MKKDRNTKISDGTATVALQILRIGSGRQHR
jgi:hypothetical protein